MNILFSIHRFRMFINHAYITQKPFTNEIRRSRVAKHFSKKYGNKG